MPVSGLCHPDLDDLPHASRVDAPLGSLVLQDVEILHLYAEIERTAQLDVLPPALHPSIPPILTLNVTVCQDGPLGPFAIAEARIGARLRDRPRAFGATSLVDGAGAREALEQRWGYRCQPAVVALRRFHDRAEVVVSAGDRLALTAALHAPEAMEGTVPYWGLVNLAATSRGPRLVPVDMEHQFTTVVRGRPVVSHFDGAAFGLPEVAPRLLVSGTYARATVEMVQANALWRIDVEGGAGGEAVG